MKMFRYQRSYRTVERSFSTKPVAPPAVTSLALVLVGYKELGCYRDPGGKRIMTFAYGSDEMTVEVGVVGGEACLPNR